MKKIELKKIENIIGGNDGRDCLLAGGAIAVGIGMIASVVFAGPGLALFASSVANSGDCWQQ